MIGTDLIASVGRAQLGAAVREVKRLAGFVRNEDFLLRTDTENYILKAGDAGAIAAEAWACERVRCEGVAAPEIVAVDLDRHLLPLAYLIERQLPGRAIDDAYDALVETGRQLRLVHSIAVDGYGFLNESKRPPIGPYPDWAAVITSALDPLDALSSQGVLSTPLTSRLQQLVQAGLTQLPKQQGVLLHGDLHPRHVFATNGQLTGIIDWGDVAVGDPLFDIGRFARADRPAISALLRGYQAEASANLSWMIWFYRTIWSLLALGWEFEAGGDWFANHLTAIQEGLAKLGY